MLHLNRIAASSWRQLRQQTSIRCYSKPKAPLKTFPHKIVSGVQPTGVLHVGNYLGAIKRWTDIQDSGANVSYFIADLHSLTVPQIPAELRQNILLMSATLLACGIDPERSTLFLQSTVGQHTELHRVFACLSTMARLGHLPQYKDKSAAMQAIPLGLFDYPVLQAADILIYKATHVPTGVDQAQHVQLAQHLANAFNYRYGDTFPLCHGLVADDPSSRVKSLRDPEKKMSKSDADASSRILVTDRPEEIAAKIEAAFADGLADGGDVAYAPESRPGLANLLVIHSLMSGEEVPAIVERMRGKNTDSYKREVADAVVAHLNPIRLRIEDYMSNAEYLWEVLRKGGEKSAIVAQQTIDEVKQKTGLGRSIVQPAIASHNRRVDEAEEASESLANTAEWPKKILTGIQPTGALHLGNYLSIIKRCTELQSTNEDVSCLIADLHAITVPPKANELDENILLTTATLLACGIDPERSTVFLQSTVREHSELCWILQCLTTMAQLESQEHYQTKAAAQKEPTLGLLAYPVLQAADVLLYKTTHVPCGHDQVPNLQLAQSLSEAFNERFGTTFPICEPTIVGDASASIKSLRNPSVKMSKTDADPKSRILLTDTPKVILGKVKKALTDFTSAVTFEPDARPGVSNLLNIHALVSGESVADIVRRLHGSDDVDTGAYKLQVADAVIEHLTPIRMRIEDLRRNPDYLDAVLRGGCERSTAVARRTIAEVKERVGVALEGRGGGAVLLERKQ